jgi:prepilin-type N-terminal cleavage/methylation domain-containing protein
MTGQHALLISQNFSRIAVTCLRTQNFFYRNSTLSRCMGFSLVELLVSSVIIAILGAGVAAVLSSGNSAFVRTRETNLLEQTIDTDLAQIKDVAFRMTCCSGSCTTETGLSTPCSTNPDTGSFYNPGQQNYYFPDPTLDTNQTAINSFITSCDSGSLVNSLTSLVDTSGLPGGITRDFDESQASSHRLTVTYSDGSQSRAYTLVPTVAAWCP